jgi:hypothetical protein
MHEPRHHLTPQLLQLLERRPKRHIKRKRLAHLPAPPNIQNELGRDLCVRRLNARPVLVDEDRAKEPDLLDCVVDIVEGDAVADVVRMLDEKEDDRGEHLCERAANQPAETDDQGAGTSDEGDDLLVLYDRQA